jgi:hypothetical protein
VTVEEHLAYRFSRDLAEGHRHIGCCPQHATRANFTVGYFNTTGTTDPLLYPSEPIAGSASGSPKSSGGIGEIDFNAWQNTRLGVQYTLYNTFNGASTSYDGAGRNASNNNSLFIFAWLAF